MYQQRLKAIYTAAKSLQTEFPDLSMDFLTQFVMDAQNKAEPITPRSSFTKLAPEQIMEVWRRCCVLMRQGTTQAQCSTIWGQDQSDYMQVGRILKQAGASCRVVTGARLYAMPALEPGDFIGRSEWTEIVPGQQWLRTADNLHVTLNWDHGRICYLDGEIFISEPRRRICKFWIDLQVLPPVGVNK